MALKKRRKILVLFAAITLSAGSAAIAADAPVVPPAPSGKSIYADQPQCRSWTDECVNCARGENRGAPVCSNIGAACQPKAIHCVEAEPAPADDKPKADQ